MSSRVWLNKQEVLLLIMIKTSRARAKSTTPITSFEVSAFWNDSIVSKFQLFIFPKLKKKREAQLANIGRQRLADRVMF